MESKSQSTENGAPTTGSVVTRRLSEVESKPISWLWPGRIARGKLSIIAGNPGLGKGLLAVDFAAIVTTGGRWPDDDLFRCEAGDVVFLSAEDDAGDTLRPRLEAAGADLSRVHIVDGVCLGVNGKGVTSNRAFSFERDIQALDAKLRELRGVALLVADPISAYLGKTDSHKDAEVRGLLAPLAEIAARYNVAVLGIAHLNKGHAKKAVMRVMGSIAFVAASRATFLVARDPQDKSRRLLVPIKNNLGPDTTGLAFHLERAVVPAAGFELETQKIGWEADPICVTADQVMEMEAVSNKPSALETACAWLLEALADGPVAAGDVHARATAAGIAKKTLERATTALGIEKNKTGMEGGWSWALPNMANAPKMANVMEWPSSPEVGNLRENDPNMTEVEL